MRASIFIIYPLFVFLSISATAQMETLFYGRPYSDVDRFIDSVKVAVSETYKISDRFFSKNGKEEFVTFNNNDGEILLVSIIKVDIGDGSKFGTVMMQGTFITMMSLFSKYFKNAFLRGRQASEHCWPLIIKDTKFGKMPISFCQNDGNKKDIWFLYNKMPYQARK